MRIMNLTYHMVLFNRLESITQAEKHESDMKTKVRYDLFSEFVTAFGGQHPASMRSIIESTTRSTNL